VAPLDSEAAGCLEVGDGGLSDTEIEGGGECTHVLGSDVGLNEAFEVVMG